ncbi:retrotransposon protein, putative, ty1-copia subclass [Tanacetum coccineum]
MASSMSLKLQKTFENTCAYEMYQQLIKMFQAKASKECLVVVKSFMACKLKPGASICAFILEMKGYFDRLESLNMVFDAELSINIILSGMPADYNQFMLSYQMNEKETSIMKLHSLLQTTEQGIKIIDVPSTSVAPVLTVGHNAKKKKTYHSNWKGKAAKGKSDRGSKRKAESEIAPTSDPKEAVSFYCNTKGNWKHSWPKYLKDLKDRKGLKESRRLKHGELNLVMGNRKIMPVIRIGKYELMLKSRDGYKFSFYNENGDILVYSNGCFMFKASPCKGIYETVECISHNGNVILNVGSSNKLDKSKLWHSDIGHVNKKRITQLQKDGVLESLDFKSDDVYESYLLGKMTKSPFIGSCERYEGLLDLVHTDLCGPFPFVTKDGKRYYVTFTDDFSRYGYVYLIKHKSDTFEVFKSGSKIDLEEIQESIDEEPIVNTETQQEVFYYGFHIKEEKISDSTLSELDEHVNYKEAMASLEAAKWKEAMKSEIRLVAKGYTQSHKIDYEETFSPVAKIKTIRIMLAIAVFHNYEIWEMDVNTTFLNRKWTKDVFMAQPEGFENVKNLCFYEKVTWFGFSRSKDESCIYVKVSKSVVVFLVLYVDDILLIGNDIPTLQSVKDWLGKCFAIEDLGDAAYILGIKIYRDRSKCLIGLS